MPAGRAPEGTVDRPAQLMREQHVGRLAVDDMVTDLAVRRPPVGRSA
ncbi:hypothetical protein [Streptomyces sp. NPDC003006]